jgi:hypothetical protein
MASGFGSFAFKNRRVLFAQLILQMTEISERPIAVELFSPPKRCDSCMNESEVFVKPDKVCAQCWSHSVFCFEPVDADCGTADYASGPLGSESARVASGVTEF